MDKEIKKYLKKEISDKDIFLKSGFLKSLQNIADSSMQYYGFSPVPIRASWDSDNEDIAWINNKECYINLDNPLVKNCSFYERKEYCVAEMVHEIFGHWLHTDFSLINTLQVADKNLYLKYFKTSHKKEIEIAFNKNRKLFEDIFFNIANIVEDPIVEYLAIEKYPGFKRYVDKLTSRLVADISEKDISDCPDYIKTINLILLKARNCFDDKYLVEYPEFQDIHCFEDLSSMPLYEDRLFATADIITVFWNYLKQAFENNDTMNEASNFLENFSKENNLNNKEENTKSSNSDENAVNKPSNRRTLNGPANIQKKLQESSDGSIGQNKESLADDSNQTLENASMNDVYDKISEEIDKTIDEIIEKIYIESDKETLCNKCDKDNFYTLFKKNNIYNKSFEINSDFEINLEAYNKTFTPEKKRISKTMAKKVLKLLTERRKGRISRGLNEGNILDVDYYAMGSDKIFMDVVKPNKKPVCAVSIMIDMSGSMTGKRSIAALDTALVLEYFCRELKIPQHVYGHYDSAGIKIQQFIDFRDRNDNKTASNLLSITETRGCNHDGYALKYGISKLSKRKESQKLLFVISDGKPSSTGYGVDEMIAEMPEIKQVCRKNNILLIPIAIGDDIENLKKIYGPSLVDGRDLSKLPIEVSKILLKQIKKLI